MEAHTMKSDNNNDYYNLCRCVFDNDPQGIHYITKDIVFLNEIKRFFPGLVPGTPRPDAVSVIDDSALLMEHFQFDNSKKTKNGSKQNCAAAISGKRLEEKLSRQSFAMVEERVEKCGLFYAENFRKNFHKHAKNVDAYRIAAEQTYGHQFKKCYQGFVIEDASPLGSVFYDNNKPKVVNLLETKEFLDCFEMTPNLDFVIFAYTGGDVANHFTSFISRETIDDYRANQFTVSNIKKFFFETTYDMGMNILLKLK